MIRCDAGLGACLATVVLLASTQPAAAAAYCLTGNTMQPQCIYESASQCRKQAQYPGFGCVPNSNEVQHVFGTGRYCVATQERIEYCLFSDFLSCNDDAQRRDAVCFDRNGIASDPYRYDIRRPF